MRNIAIVVCLIISGLAVPLRGVVAQAVDHQEHLPDTLSIFRRVTALSDSSSIVEAASDALQGRNGFQIPMTVSRFERGRSGILVELQPIKDPKVQWVNYGGTVRVLRDGRRVRISRLSAQDIDSRRPTLSRRDSVEIYRILATEYAVSLEAIRKMTTIRLSEDGNTAHANVSSGISGTIYSLTRSPHGWRIRDETAWIS